jgi:uncharacterized membrane protein
MNKMIVFRWMTLLGYFGLMLSLLAWITLPTHSSQYPAFALLIVGVLPLLFPLRGLLHGKPYTHAWAAFLFMAYFTHGVGEVYSAASFTWYASLEVLFSSLSFFGSIFYVKYEAQSRKAASDE